MAAGWEPARGPKFDVRVSRPRMATPRQKPHSSSNHEAQSYIRTGRVQKLRAFGMPGLGTLATHLGQKVIHLRDLESALHAFSRYEDQRRISPSVKFSGRQGNGPVVLHRVVLDELAGDR